MKPETKTSLGAVAVLLCSLAYVYLIAFSNQITELAVVVAAVAVAAAAVVAGGGGAAAAAVVAVVAVVAGVVIVITTYDKEKNKIFTAPAFLLLLVFVLPLAGIFPLSKYHNLKQLERDGKIASVLQISADSNNVTVVLPVEYAGENSYMEKVLSIRTEPNEPNSLKPWKELAVYCREGQKEWYKAVLLGAKKESLVLFFNHAWEDKTIILPIP